MSIRLIAKSVWQNPGNRGKRVRKSFAAFAWQLQKRVRASSRTMQLANGMRFNAHVDCVTSSSLIYADWPEYAELTFLRDRLSSGDVIIDVGANVGHFSLLLADLVGTQNVVAFEPAPRTFARLAQNWALNGLPTNNLFNCAVGASAGAVFIENDVRPTTTLQVSELPTSARSTRVPLVRLDDFRHLWEGSRVGVLKIDVEGFERAVFEGADRLLGINRPRLIMFESLSSTVDAGISAILTGHHYVVFQLDEHGQPDFANHSAQNLFAVPEERLAADRVTA